jgi:hypothetical protein
MPGSRETAEPAVPSTGLSATTPAPSEATIRRVGAELFLTVRMPALSRICPRVAVCLRTHELLGSHLAVRCSYGPHRIREGLLLADVRMTVSFSIAPKCNREPPIFLLLLFPSEERSLVGMLSSGQIFGRGLLATAMVIRQHSSLRAIASFSGRSWIRC